MNLSVFNPVLYGMNFLDAVKYLKSQGVNYMELGCGGFPGTTHADAKELIKNKKKLSEVIAILKDNDMKISALSVHGNPVHPLKKIAENYNEDFKAACELANGLEVSTVITFSGCPGGSKEDKTPNWVTCPWPEDFTEILKYQWNDVLLPYWHNAAVFAKEKGVSEIALEMHPGFCVYNGETLLKLRSAIGNIIGANFDPSHLIWQGIDPVYALKVLLKENAVYNFHAKDTRIDKYNTSLNGVLDTKSYTDEINRSWIFRTVGYGSSDIVWKDMISLLSVSGYTRCLSIEHEDSLMTTCEGLEKAIAYLKNLIILCPKPTSIHWA